MHATSASTSIHMYTYARQFPSPHRHRVCHSHTLILSILTTKRRRRVPAHTHTAMYPSVSLPLSHPYISIESSLILNHLCIYIYTHRSHFPHLVPVYIYIRPCCLRVCVCLPLARSPSMASFTSSACCSRQYPSFLLGPTVGKFLTEIFLDYNKPFENVHSVHFFHDTNTLGHLNILGRFVLLNSLFEFVCSFTLCFSYIYIYM